MHLYICQKHEEETRAKATHVHDLCKLRVVLPLEKYRGREPGNGEGNFSEIQNVFFLKQWLETNLTE